MRTNFRDVLIRINPLINNKQYAKKRMRIDVEIIQQTAQISKINRVTGLSILPKRQRNKAIKILIKKITINNIDVSKKSKIYEYTIRLETRESIRAITRSKGIYGRRKSIFC